MNTGGQLAVDAGDITPNPPPINENTPSPHEYRGECNLCHVILRNNNQGLSQAELNNPPEGRAAAAQNDPGTFFTQPENQKFALMDTANQWNSDGNRWETGGTVRPNAGNPSRPNRLSWLGIEAVSVTPDIAREFDLKDVAGVLVDNVKPNSPAEGIGLSKGDVITHMGKVPIKDINHLKEIVRPLGPGSEIELTIVRDHKEYSLDFLIGKRPGLRERFRSHPFGFNMVLVVGVFVLVYIFVINNLLGRIIAFPLGAAAVLYLGYEYEFYNLPQAAKAINYHVLMFIVGMNFTTAVLHEAGFFDYLSKKIALYTLGDRLKLFLLFSLLTYVVSAFMDNIATIMVMIPLTLTLARELNFDPKPLLIGEIISSNLGGASTMFGDFPNLLISLSTNLQFHDFIIYEAPCCIVLLISMFIYMFVTQKKFFITPEYSGEDARLFSRIKKDMRTAITNSNALFKGLCILGLIIMGLIFSKQVGINPAYFALIGGVVLLLISGIPRMKVLKQGGWGDVIFFTALFIMVGAAEASGVLVLFAEEVVFKLSAGNMLITAVLIMCFAAFLAAFLNAGPTAAIFIPIIIHFGIMPPHYLYWWALSLGVVAGSSASLYGASGGPLASSIIGKFWRRNKKTLGPDSMLSNLKKSMSFKEYFQVGGPILIIFLIISIAYIVFLYYLT
jgi:Na+/H+ antiporter NhaD/arsenite permease-like protein